jgi:hypothetical protein
MNRQPQDRPKVLVVLSCLHTRYFQTPAPRRGSGCTASNAAATKTSRKRHTTTPCGATTAPTGGVAGNARSKRKPRHRNTPSADPGMPPSFMTGNCRWADIIIRRCRSTLTISHPSEE